MLFSAEHKGSEFDAINDGHMRQRSSCYNTGRHRKPTGRRIWRWHLYSCVDAVLRLKGAGDLNAIESITKLCCTFEYSFLNVGFLLDEQPGVLQPKKPSNAKIPSTNLPMDSDKIKVLGKTIKVDSCQTIFNLEIAEKTKMNKKIATIFNHACNDFVNCQCICKYPAQLFPDADIMAFGNAASDGIERLTALIVSDGESCSTFGDLSVSHLGGCEVIEQLFFGVNAACPILRDTIAQTIDEPKHDASSVLTSTMGNSCIVYGDSCAKTLKVNAMFKLTAKTTCAEAVAMETHAKALLSLPTAISDSSGWFSAQLTTEPSASHAQL